MQIKSIKLSDLTIIIFVIFGIFFRAYNLNWGNPFEFHPDEYNLLLLLKENHSSFLELIQAGTFSYGNLSNIYLSLIKNIVLSYFNLNTFDGLKLLLRLQSLLYSSSILCLVYLIGKVWSKNVAVLVVGLSAFSVGLIQQSHFGTLDTMITFWLLVSFYFSLIYFKNKRNIFLYASVFAIIFASAAKISSGIFIIVPILINLTSKKRLSFFLFPVFAVLLLSAGVVLLSSYYLSSDFQNLLGYEQSIVTGKQIVFYTQGFYKTIPVVFQFFHIYPFLLNPLSTILLIPASLYLIYLSFKKRGLLYIFPVLTFSLLFFPQAFLFAKWSRYMLPTIPLVYLIISIAFFEFIKSKKITKTFSKFIVFVLILISFLYAFFYFLKISNAVDTRIQARDWAEENIEKEAFILIEDYDLGGYVFSSFPNIHKFDFYSIDFIENKNEQLKELLKKTEYVILPSQRILKSRIQNPKIFPEGNKLYKKLLTEKNGFKKVYESNCDIICKLLYSGGHIFWLEETATVFDRPTVFIFKRIR